jgi:hypothetical protein
MAELRIERVRLNASDPGLNGSGVESAGKTDEAEGRFRRRKVPAPDPGGGKNLEERLKDQLEILLTQLEHREPGAVETSRRETLTDGGEMFERIKSAFTVAPRDDQIANNDIELFARAAEEIAGILQDKAGSRLPTETLIGIGEMSASDLGDFGHEFQSSDVRGPMEEGATGGDASAVAQESDAPRVRVKKQRDVRLEAFVTRGERAAENIVVIELKATGTGAFHDRYDAVSPFLNREELFAPGGLHSCTGEIGSGKKQSRQEA